MTDLRAHKYRARRFVEQQQRCFYCGFPMWNRRPTRFAKRFGISLKEAKRFRCTAEHVEARCNGGSSRQDNIVAACWHCNHHRHELTVAPDAARYRAHVKGRVARGAWHPDWLHKMLLTLV